MEVGNPLVPILRPDAPRIRARDERPVALDGEFGLEGVGGVPVPVARLRGPPAVDQKDRHGSRAFGKSALEVGNVNVPLDHMQPQAAGVGDFVIGWGLPSRQRYADGRSSRQALPHFLPLRSLRPLVVAP